MRRLVLVAAALSVLLSVWILRPTGSRRIRERPAAAPFPAEAEEPPAPARRPAAPPQSKEAIAETRQQASGQPGVVVNEVLFHPLSGEPADEWIELWNRGLAAVDLSGFRLDGPIKYAFPPGTVLPSGEYLVVAADRDRARAALGLPGILGNWTGKLKRSGGAIRLLDASGTETMAIPYGNLPPLPAGGPGISLDFSVHLSGPSVERDAAAGGSGHDPRHCRLGAAAQGGRPPLQCRPG